MIPSTTRFLLADDISAIREMLKLHLKEMGFTTKPVEVDTVAKAIDFLSKQSTASSDEKIDFILCDWNFPDGIGLEVLKQVRANPYFNNTPFVMVTTQNEINYILDAINHGCNNYVTKPWTLKDLQEKINRAWESIQSKKTGTKPPPVTPPPKELTPDSPIKKVILPPKNEKASPDEKTEEKKLPPIPTKARSSLTRHNIKKKEEIPPKKDEKKPFWKRFFGL